MKIRILPLLVGGGGIVLNALAASPESSSKPCAESVVTMPLSELRALWEKSLPAPPVATPKVPEPPVKSVVSELALDLTFGEDACRGTLSAQIQSFTAEWQRVALIGGDLAVETVKGQNAVEVFNERYGVLLQQAAVCSLELAVALPPASSWTAESPVVLNLESAACRRVLLHGVPDGYQIQYGERRLQPTESGELSVPIRLTDSAVSLALVPRDTKATPSSGLQLAQAVVPTFVCKQRLVMDGGLLSQASLSVRHQGKTTLSVALPVGADLLQCTVDGLPARPNRTEKGIDLDLPEAADAAAGSKLELAYFTKLLPLSPSGGSLNLELPHTDLFHELLEWEVTLPEGLQSSGLKSNATPVKPVQAAQTISLKREFWKSDPVSAEVFYEARRQ